MIKLTHVKATLGDIHISNLFQTPKFAFSNFWNGSKEDYEEYLNNYNIDSSLKDITNIEQLHTMVSKNFLAFEKAVNKNIGQFNFLLRSALKPRNLPPLELEDYMKLEIDLSEESPDKKEEIKNNFLSSVSRSFVDFRNIINDKLIFIYNRRGAVNEGDRIAICKAKQSITLKDNFKAAKDNNFIISGLLKDIAIKDTTFIFTYLAGNDFKELKAEASEILEAAKSREEYNINNVISQNDINIKDEAKLEIKKENLYTRQSLPPESIYNEITKEANSEIELKDDVDSTIRDYETKELEKLRLRLLKSKELAIDIYKELKTKIENGDGILESLNILKQKYREEHAVNLASIYLSNDLLEVAKKDKLILSLKTSIAEKQKELDNKDIEISKREDTLYSLRSTLSQKENDIRLLKENMEDVINDLQTQTNNTIFELKEAYEKKQDLLEKDLLESDELISRQNEKLNYQEQQICSLNEKIDIMHNENITLISNNQELKTTNENLLNRLEISEKEFKVLKEIQDCNVQLTIENKNLYNEKQLLNLNINDLKTMLDDLKKRNLDLEEKLNSIQNDYKDIVNKMVDNIESKNDFKKIGKPKSNIKDILEKGNSNARTK